MEHRSATILLLLFLLGSSLSGQTLAPSLAPNLDTARALHVAGKLREAADAYRAVAEANAANPPLAATARNNACAVFNELADFRAALKECEAALRLRRRQGDPLRLARTLNNAGLSLHYLGEYQEAEDCFREALESNRIAGDIEGQVINFSNLGLVATSQGRYNQALDLHGMAAELASRHPEEPWAAVQSRISRINQGVILEKLGAYREALDVYKSVSKEEDELDPLRRAMLRVNTGVVYRNLGDPVSAEAAFRDAMAIYEAEGDRAGLSNAWLNLGLVHHLNLRQPRAAEEAFRKALGFARASGDRSEEIQDLFYLGRLLLEQSRTDEAGAVFTQSLEAAGRSGSAEGRWSALEGLGRVAAARGDPGHRGDRSQDARGVELLEQAMGEIEKVRSSLRRSTLRSHFFGERRPVYALAVELLARMDAREPGAGHAERALDIVQRAKIRELLDTLGSAGREASPLAAGALREKVGDGILLEYFLGEENLFLWVVRGDGIRMANLGPYEPILADAVAVHGALSRRQAPDPARLARLSRVLLGPAGDLEDPSEVRIAPDGSLRYLPFEILADPGSPGALLLDRAPVSYLPSGSALGWLRSLGYIEPVFTLVGFGSPEIPRDSAAGELAARYRLPPLPGAERELEVISELLPGQHDLHTGLSAGEEDLRRTLAKGARIVHLATHAVIDERPGRGAAILLAPGDGEDGLLYPEEIVNLRYEADLTVLAGCRTALSPGAEEGDALSSLTGAFLASGSPGVLATLWEVGDEATATFMEQLYHELGKGRRPAEALRRAKQRLRQDSRWNRPDLWAGYVLTGEVPPVAYTERTRYVIGVLLLAAIALTPFFLDWRVARRLNRPRKEG